MGIFFDFSFDYFFGGGEVVKDLKICFYVGGFVFYVGFYILILVIEVVIWVFKVICF